MIAVGGVMIGGAFGALCRYLLTIGMQSLLRGTSWATFPLATLVVNVVGSLLLSLLFHLSTPALSPNWRLALGTGFLGSFTTFSTFELESTLLAERGESLRTVLYIGGNLGLGFGAVLLGRLIAQRTL
ncbi:MAG: fluoride efflux transporter CrcB [Trueperaceae bacterium]|nr:fluoride efflux transporter CrcB [Trueperaceae bacterium]